MKKEFLIHELAERAGTTVRTIRYYTDQGLLPQPILTSRYAYYTSVHLERLELIQRLKVSYLPLREIREIMNTLSDEEVHQRLVELNPPDQADDSEARPARTTPGPGSRALEYIARLMDEPLGFRAGERFSSDPTWQPKDPNEAEPFASSPHRVSSSRSTDESWQRIALAPGIELHVRAPAEPGIAGRVQQLIAFAQKLFRKV